MSAAAAENTAVASVQQLRAPSLVEKFASRFGVEPAKMLATLKSTAFKTKQGDPEVTNEQMMALLIVADQYGLNPWTKEIFAFPDKGGIVPVLGVDGWSRIINESPEFNGIEFKDEGSPMPVWIECSIYRKDREHPTTVREYMSECKRSTGPWGSHPRRMLRHKAMIQCARIAFGFVGINDPDEAERIIERDVTPAAAEDPFNSKKPLTGAAALKAAVVPGKTGPATIEHETEDPAAGMSAESVDKSTGEIAGTDDGAPEVNFEALLAKLKNGNDADVLDADAALIGQVRDQAQQNTLAEAYKARRAELAKPKKK